MADLDMDALTEPQRNVLGWIAIGQDRGHHSSTLKALEAKGLIVGHSYILTSQPPVKVTRWGLPIAVHIQWAEWCSRQVEAG
jgi:hypothetical protein